MNRTNIFITVALLFFTNSVCSLMAASGPAPYYYTIKLIDRQGNTEYQAMSKSEYLQLEKDIREERRVFSKAQQLAEKDWKNSAHIIRYPGRALKPRKVTVYRRFRLQGEAESAVLKKNAAINNRKDEKKRREQRFNNTNQRGNRNNNRNWNNNRYNNNGRYAENARIRAIRRRQQNKKVRNEGLNEAEALLDQHITSLISKQEGVLKLKKLPTAENNNAEENNAEENNAENKENAQIN